MADPRFQVRKRGLGRFVVEPPRMMRVPQNADRGRIDPTEQLLHRRRIGEVAVRFQQNVDLEASGKRTEPVKPFGNSVEGRSSLGRALTQAEGRRRRRAQSQLRARPPIRRMPCRSKAGPPVRPVADNRIARRKPIRKSRTPVSLPSFDRGSRIRGLPRARPPEGGHFEQIRIAGNLPNLDPVETVTDPRRHDLLKVPRRTGEG